MAEILNIDPSLDLKQCLLWQYTNSPALRDLLNEKSTWYAQNQEQFWNDWYTNVFNIDTANDFGLSVWGQILSFSRNVKGKDDNLHYLTREQYRMVLKGQLIKFGMGATAPEINNWISIVFKGKENAYCVDSYDMTAIPFVFRSVPTDEIKWLLGNIDFFPRPAGVGYEVRVIPNTVFGFNGSHLQPFNQGVFQNDYSEILNPPAVDTYQLSINAPQDATVLINGEETRYALVEDRSEYTWSVSKDGYISAQGSGTITAADVNVSISTFTVNDTTGIGSVFVNNQSVNAAYFQTGTNFNYSYSVGAYGYISASGSGVATQDYTVSISALTIVPTPANATVVLNGQTATGAFFVTGSIFEYSYIASAYGYDSKNGSGTATGNEQVNITLAPVSWSYSQTGIQSNYLPSVLTTLYEQPIPYDGNYTITLAAGAGWNGSNYLGGGISEVAGAFTAGQPVKIVAIKGNNDPEHTRYAGNGLALYVNNVLVAVSGGGATGSNRSGGGGFVGGYDSVRPGYSIDGTLGNSTLQNTGACGSYASYKILNTSHIVYGGSSYANTSLGYSIRETYGLGTTQGNCGLSYFVISKN